jgi:hypothetical protein
MIQLNNGLNNYIGFNSAGGAKLASEPVEQTFVIFGYFSGTAGDNQLMSKIGAYDGNSNTNNGTPHTIFNGLNRAVIITSYDVNENPVQYYIMPTTGAGAPKVSKGYFLFSYTAITDPTQNSGTYRTILNVKLYPNVDLGTTKTVYNTTKESILHDFELGYWSVQARSFRGTFGEIMYFNRKLTDNERFILEGKIAWKYGQAAILPASHPYKTVAPA